MPLFFDSPSGPAKFAGPWASHSVAPRRGSQLKSNSVDDTWVASASFETAQNAWDGTFDHDFLVQEFIVNHQKTIVSLVTFVDSH